MSSLSLTSQQFAINAGQCFTASNRYSSVANGSSVSMEIITPNNGVDTHLQLYSSFIDSGVGYLELIEAPTLTTGSTLVTPINRNRKSSNTANVVVKSNPTSISGGTTLESYDFGGTGGQGSIYSTGISENFKYILKPNTTYILRVTNNSGSAQNVEIFAAWVEQN